MADTREDILRTAGRMLQMKGFNSFSFAHVAEQLGVKPAAIHYHFKTKTDLGVALIARYHMRYKTIMEDAETLPPHKQLEGFFAMFQRFAEDGRVCFEGVLQAEWNAVPPEMQAALGPMIAEVHAWLTRVIEQGRKAGTITFVGKASDKAAVIAATVQGALQAARVRGKPFFEGAIRQLRTELMA
ncbi:MAG: TetR/AcrR family transcriptional regulator [Deltaproteobacteria bacterium]|nr:TetR/AcrR family transcriptional regulator [Deltaproteobacteria bacterium]